MNRATSAWSQMICSLILIVCSVPCFSADEDRNQYLSGQIIIKVSKEIEFTKAGDGMLHSGIPDLDFIHQICEINDCKRLFQSEALNNIYLLSFGSDRSPEAVAEKYRQSSHVVYAEPNYIAGIGSGLDTVPNDSDFGDQWGLHNTGQAGGTPDADIDAPEAWDLETGDSSVVIAILDTGIDLDHPDLAGKIVAGYDFVNGDNEAQDDNGHGTHVAGIAAAETNNDEGIAGVCWGCSLMPVKVLGADGNGPYSRISAGVEYAADQGARIINLSLGSTSSSQLLQDVIDYAHEMGCVIVASVGNLNTDDMFYPAACENVLAVAALDRNNVRYQLSNYGFWVDVCAPGVQIRSTVYNNTYSTWSGTSMAAPFVSGVAGLLFSAYAEWDNFQVESHIKRLTDDINGVNPNYTDQLGSGKINAFSNLITPSTADISFVSKTIIDSVPGDGDGELDPGESVDLIVTLHNDWAATTGVSAILTTSDEYITIEDGNGTFGDIGSQQSMANDDDPFFLSLDLSCPSGHVILFGLDVQDVFSNTWHFEFTAITGSVVYMVPALIMENTTWYQNNTYMVPTSGVTVRAVLTIEPGVTVKFMGSSMVLSNHGRIYAIGTIDNPIIFVNAESYDQWGGFVFNVDPSQPIQHFEYCTIKDAYPVVTNDNYSLYANMIFNHNKVYCYYYAGVFAVHEFIDNTFNRVNENEWLYEIEAELVLFLDSDQVDEYYIKNNNSSGTILSITINDLTPYTNETIYVEHNTLNAIHREPPESGMSQDNSHRIFIQRNQLSPWTGTAIYGHPSETIQWNIFAYENVVLDPDGPYYPSINHTTGIRSVVEASYNVIEGCTEGIVSCSSIHHNNILHCKSGIKDNTYDKSTLWKTRIDDEMDFNLLDMMSYNKLEFFLTSTVHSRIPPFQHGCHYNNILWNNIGVQMAAPNPPCSQYQFNNFTDPGVPVHGTPCYTFKLCDRSNIDSDATSCYWGDITTNEMEIENVWPIGVSNIDAIYDLWDDNRLELVDFSYWQHSPVQESPGYLWRLTLEPPSPVGLEDVVFTLTFNRAMDTSIMPIVTFGLEPPYDSHQVMGEWQTDSKTWIGQFPVDYYTGDGLNRIVVSEARDLESRVAPTDQSYSFVIETGIGAVQGLAAAALESAIDITWQANYEPDLAGYLLYYDFDFPEPPYEGSGAWQGASPIRMGKVNTATLTNLMDGITYYISIRAYDRLGHIGPYSIPVSATFSTPYTPQPTPIPVVPIPASGFPGMLILIVVLSLLIVPLRKS